MMRASSGRPVRHKPNRLQSDVLGPRTKHNPESPPKAESGNARQWRKKAMMSGDVPIGRGAAFAGAYLPESYADIEAAYLADDDRLTAATGNPSSVIPGSNMTEGDFAALDEEEQKKQRRLIRNRLSAQLHRQRQRAHIDTLEAQVTELSTLVECYKSALASIAQACTCGAAHDPNFVSPLLRCAKGPTTPGTLGFTGAGSEHGLELREAVRSLVKSGADTAVPRGAKKGGPLTAASLGLVGIFIDAVGASPPTKSKLNTTSVSPPKFRPAKRGKAEEAVADSNTTTSTDSHTVELSADARRLRVHHQEPPSIAVSRSRKNQSLDRVLSGKKRSRTPQVEVAADTDVDDSDLPSGELELDTVDACATQPPEPSVSLSLAVPPPVCATPAVMARTDSIDPLTSAGIFDIPTEPAERTSRLDGLHGAVPSLPRVPTWGVTEVPVTSPLLPPDTWGFSRQMSFSSITGRPPT